MSITEMLVAMTVLGLFLALSAFLVGPLLRAPNQHQVKVDTIETAADGVYRLQQSLRNSNEGGIYTCSAGSPVTCTALPSSFTSISAVAICSPLTGGNGAASVDSTTFAVKWQGLKVFWLAGNTTGGNDLRESFQAITASTSLPTAAQAQTAVTAALASTNYLVAAPNVQTLSVNGNSATHVIGLKMVAKSTLGGRWNSTSYESDTYARN